MKSPKKIFFSLKEQNEILSKVKKIMEPISKNRSVIRIVIEGSAARKKLGRYERKYHGRFYSDIDILIIADSKIKMPRLFIEDYNLPSSIKKVTKGVCYRYIYNRKIEGRLPLHVHVFNKNIHNKRLALRSGLNVDWPVDKKKAIVIYKRIK